MENIIQVDNRSFTKYIDSSAIEKIVIRMAKSIHESELDNLVFIVILKGAFIFASDLIRTLDIDAKIEFIRLSSYHEMKSTGSVEMVGNMNTNLDDKNIIIIEDIVETGLSMHFFKEHLHKQYHPKSVQLASLLVKPKLLQHDVKVDYVGLEIEDEFVVGYGLDYNGLGRGLEHIYQVIE